MKTARITAFFALVISVCIFMSACDNSGGGGVIIPPDSGSGDDTSGGDTGDPGTGDPGTGVSDPIKLVFAGDTMMDRKVKKSVDNNGNGDYRFLFEYTADYLKGADLAFTNLESMISDAGYAQVYFEIAFEADPAAIEGLTYAGIDVVSVANNHAFDYTRSAFSDCLDRLSAAGIAPIGGGGFEEAYTPRVFDVKGTRIAFLAFTLTGNISESTMAVQEDDPDREGVAWYYPEYADPAIQRAKSMADVVVVSIHFGEEYETEPDDEQVEVARHCIDQGAHLVVGHHPHVVQPLASYGGGRIAYSLGNFIFDQADEATHRGMVLEVTVRDKKIESAVDRYIDINEYYQPVME